MATIYGYWTCESCSSENRGDQYHCTNCSAPRGKDVKFYIRPKGTAEPEQYAPKSKGPDWHCPYCNSLNPAVKGTCQNCGHPRSNTDKDYFELHPEEKGFRPIGQDFGASEPEAQAIQTRFSEPTYEEKTTSLSFPFNPRRLLLILAIIPIVSLIIFALVKLFTPTVAEATIINKSWTRQVIVEEYRTFHEEGWFIPSGGRETGSYKAIHHYDQVLDHYRTVTKSRQVADGGHYEVVGYRSVPNGSERRVVGYTNNGDGTFDEVIEYVTIYTTEEVTEWVTDYKTEYYTEQEPVYRDEPVYRTKYRYDIERWTFDHYETTSGHLDEPYFATPDLAPNCRQNGTEESYSVTVSCVNRKGETITTECAVGYLDWQALEVGQVVQAKIYAGNIVKFSLAPP